MRKSELLQFRLKPQTKELLRLIAERQELTMAEVLIDLIHREANKLKIKTE